MEGSAEGSTQIYFGQKYLSLKSVFDLFPNKKKEMSTEDSAQIPLGQ